MNSDTLMKTLLALPAEERERLALELWRSVHGRLDAQSEKALVERIRQHPKAAPEPSPPQKAAHRRVFGPSAVDLEQRALDERCVRFGHLDRSIAHCANPRCPSTHPDAWRDFRAIRGLDLPDPSSS